MRFLPVKDYTGLMKDTVTKAVISVDENAYQKAKNLKKRQEQREERIAKLEEDVSEIKSLLTEIKDLINGR